MAETSYLLWAIFAALISGAIIFDLGVFNRRAHHIGTAEALITSIVWILLAMLFQAWYMSGGDPKTRFNLYQDICSKNL